MGKSCLCPLAGVTNAVASTGEQTLYWNLQGAPKGLVLKAWPKASVKWGLVEERSLRCQEGDVGTLATASSSMCLLVYFIRGLKTMVLEEHALKPNSFPWTAYLSDGNLNKNLFSPAFISFGDADRSRGAGRYGRLLLFLLAYRVLDAMAH